ncbi:peptidoglycan DD-metalloendopeptidase family protein [Paenarthrobacter nicotinovorans]|uniref:Peptidoglycan DD-metalloendopeptidase family protein n=1 Tax=Paenarthrobacter nicotinovorans TaxID=29320 RepID=A0ABV0GM06_PAENI
MTPYAGFLPRHTRPLGLALALCLTAALLSAPAAARAANLDDQQKDLETQSTEVKASLEFLDSKLAEAAGDLVIYQGRLPDAQEALQEAQGRVASAVKEAETWAARVSLAQQSKATITAELEEDKNTMTKAKKLIGQIASQAYKSGGIPTDIALLLEAREANDLTKSMDLVEQAMRSQNTAFSEAAQKNAANLSSQTRLASVEEELLHLKAKSDAAVEKEKSARDEAAGRKAEVTKLIADSAHLYAQLQTAKPNIEAKLAKVRIEQETVAAEIAERDRKLREAWESEQRRLAATAASDAANANPGKPAPHQPTYVPPAVGPPSAFGLRHPFAGQVPITSGFGWRATPPGTIDFNGTGGYMHTGIDFGAACGTPVYAAGSGTVFSSGWNAADGGGWRVKLSHGVLQGNSLTTVYYHNSSIVVSNGQQVTQGQLIAYSGSTGNSTGCHAHFETWLNSSPVDPRTLL